MMFFSSADSSNPGIAPPRETSEMLTTLAFVHAFVPSDVLLRRGHVHTAVRRCSAPRAEFGDGFCEARPHCAATKLPRPLEIPADRAC